MGEFNFLFVAIADLISNKSLKTSNWIIGHLDKCPPSFKIKFSDKVLSLFKNEFILFKSLNKKIFPIIRPFIVLKLYKFVFFFNK